MFRAVRVELVVSARVVNQSNEYVKIKMFDPKTGLRPSPRFALQGTIIGWAFAIVGPLVGLSHISCLRPGGTIQWNGYQEDDLLIRLLAVFFPLLVGVFGVHFIRAASREERDRDLGLTPEEIEARNGRRPSL